MPILACLEETKELPEDEALLKAQKILSAVYRTSNRFGAVYITKVLKGSSDQRIIDNGHDSLNVYGLMADETDRSIRNWIDQLIVQGHLLATDGEYPLLKLTQSGLEVCKGTKVRLGIPVRQKLKPIKRTSPAAVSLTESERELFEKLRRLRLLISRSLGIPPYMVFADTVLSALAQHTPTNREELLNIKGIGKHKATRYGPPFLECILGACPDEVASEFRKK